MRRRGMRAVDPLPAGFLFFFPPRVRRFCPLTPQRLALVFELYLKPSPQILAWPIHSEIHTNNTSHDEEADS